jgi:hypothetical protein
MPRDDLASEHYHMGPATTSTFAIRKARRIRPGDRRGRANRTHRIVEHPREATVRMSHRGTPFNEV